MDVQPDRQHRKQDGWVRRTWPIRWTDFGLLLGCYVAMTALWCGVGAAIVHFTPGTPIGNADQHLEEWFVDRRTTRLDDLSLAGSMMAETAIKVAITAIVCLVLMRLFHRWFESLVIAVSLILEAMVFLTVTLLVKRPRPDVPRLDGSPVSTSFPSGHVAAAVCYSAMAVVLFWHTRRYWIRALAVVVSVLVPVIVALSRMYRGMHHLTDVVAGMFIGAMSVALVTVILRRAEARRRGDLAGDLAVAERPTAVHASHAPEIREPVGAASPRTARSVETIS